MLLQHIVEKLDAELARLLALRAIVSSLEGPMLLANIEVADPILMDRSDELAVPVEPVQKTPIKGRPKQRHRRSEAKVTESHRRPAQAATPGVAPALAKSIPTGPVVVSAAALAKERESRSTRPDHAEGTRRPEPGSLGAMIRSMQLRTAQLS
jgi:hypothetical protein